MFFFGCLPDVGFIGFACEFAVVSLHCGQPVGVFRRREVSHGRHQRFHAGTGGAGAVSKETGLEIWLDFYYWVCSFRRKFTRLPLSFLLHGDSKSQHLAGCVLALLYS
jgi:hypothetical protein